MPMKSAVKGRGKVKLWFPVERRTQFFDYTDDIGRMTLKEFLVFASKKDAFLSLIIDDIDSVSLHVTVPYNSRTDESISVDKDMLVGDIRWMPGDGGSVKPIEVNTWNLGGCRA